MVKQISETSSKTVYDTSSWKREYEAKSEILARKRCFPAEQELKALQKELKRGQDERILLKRRELFSRRHSNISFYLKE